MISIEREIITSREFKVLLARLAKQLIENHNFIKSSVIIGIQPRGVLLANCLKNKLEKLLDEKIIAGSIDTTFYRDDFGRKNKPLLPSVTNLDFSIADKNVILIDDVLFTGRTVRAAMDAMLAYGRPKSIELLVLIDRRFSRNLPIQANYIGKSIDSISSERVELMWSKTGDLDKVILRKNE